MNAYSSRARAVALALGMLGAALWPASLRAQADVPVKVTVTAGGRTETLRGTGQCGYEPHASIYDTSASLWMVDFSEDDRLVALRLWRPVGGGTRDQVSLLVQSGPTLRQISTLEGGEQVGSAHSTFQPTAQGGRFEIDGKDQMGAALSVILECARFGPISAVGG